MKPKTVSTEYIWYLDDLLELALEGDSGATEHVYMFGESKTVTAPEWMKAAARKGMKIRDKQPKSNKCCTPTGLARANQIIDGKPMSLSTIKRLKSFVARHAGQMKGDIDPNSKQAQGLMLWGSPATKAGAERTIKWADAQIKKLEAK